MTRPIQALAPGFLGLLGLKQGANPADLVDAVQPCIDIFPFYAMGGRQTIQFASVATQNLGATGRFSFPELTVPANQTWWVHGLTISVAVPAGMSCTFVTAHYERNTITVHTAPPVTCGGAAATALDQSLGGFLAAPGDLFGVMCSAVTGAGPFVASAGITFTPIII